MKAEDRAYKAYPYNGDYRGQGDSNSKFREAYIKGYHQAEKDLDVVSWIKEVSGVKELSRAKEEALKAYPPRSIAANYGTINRRDAFEYGYLKAEKDLELTWEDIKLIWNITDEMDNMPEEEFYKEVLKRFKNMKDGGKR